VGILVFARRSRVERYIPTAGKYSHGCHPDSDSTRIALCFRRVLAVPRLRRIPSIQIAQVRCHHGSHRHFRYIGVLLSRAARLSSLEHVVVNLLGWSIFNLLMLFVIFARNEEHPAGAALTAWVEPGRTGRAFEGLPADDQRHRDRALRAQPSLAFAIAQLFDQPIEAIFRPRRK